MPARLRTTAVALLGAVVLAPASAASAAPGNPAGRVDAPRPFLAELDGVFAGHPCPAAAPAGALCITDVVTGRILGTGRVTGRFEVVFDVAAADDEGCAPIRKQGVLATSDGDRLNLDASGRFCFPTSVADYVYRVTGGTGRFGGARGAGIWHVPAPERFDPADSSGSGPELLVGILAARR